MSVNVYNKTNNELKLIAGGLLYADAPVGSIVPYGGATAPNGWLMCQGQAVSRTTYAELFAVIGTNFGTGDGSTTFNIPDLRETIPVGIGENNSQTIANHDVYTLGEFKDDSLGKHDHPLIVTTRATYNTAGVPIGIGNNNTPTTATHGKQLGVNYIIKAKMIAVPADFVQSMSEFEKYSTNEVLTNKTWMDGKPIYRKIVEKNLTFIGNSWNNTDVDVSDIDTLCNCVLLSNKFACTGFYTKKASNQLQLYCVSDANWSAHAIILEYTKTTNG